MEKAPNTKLLFFFLNYYFGRRRLKGKVIRIFQSDYQKPAFICWYKISPKKVDFVHHKYAKKVQARTWIPEKKWIH